MLTDVNIEEGLESNDFKYTIIFVIITQNKILGS